LLNNIVTARTSQNLDLAMERGAIEAAYLKIKSNAKAIDGTLAPHVEALETKAMKKLSDLQKKMLRAEKRKFNDEARQLSKIFTALFPGGNLQERTENFMLFYAKWGTALFDMLYDNSLTLEQQFCIVEELE
jgi:bacillithiol synthase